MKKTVLFGAIFLIFSSFMFYNNSSFADLIQIKLNAYSTINWPEKVYVQTDKPYYALGETIWFTAYLVNGISHQKSDKSSMIYVELIDNNGAVVDKKRLYCENTSAAGDFTINTSYASGEYHIRAYTNYMLNENLSTFFIKEINIMKVTAQRSTGGTLATDSGIGSIGLEKPNLRFFPEGGYLIENLNSKVAVKFMDEAYQFLEIPVEIVDSNGEIFTAFSTVDYGLGYFYIKPLPDQTYFAKIKINGTTFQYELPKPLSTGYSVHTNFKDKELLISLSSTTESGLKGSYLVLHQRGKLLYDNILTTAKEQDIIQISTLNLQNGVTHITLFNPEGKPVCERLVFLSHPENKASISIQKSAEVYGSREKVTLKLQTNDYNSSIIPSTLSMSVRDTDAIPHDANRRNIKSWLLLNSDLRGKIKDPGYFFKESDGIKKAFLLDLVMMTNGWRRFTWQSLLDQPIKENKYAIEKGFFITGTTTMLEAPNSPLKTINTLSFYGDTFLELPPKTSNENGSFEFGPYIFYDSIQAIVQSRIVNPKLYEDLNYRDVKINIDTKKHQSPPLGINSKTTINVKNTIRTDVLQDSKYIERISLESLQNTQQLDEVVLTATKKATKLKQRDIQMAKRSFFNSPTRRVDIASDAFLSKTRLPLLFQRFPGITLTNNGPVYRSRPCKILINNIAVNFRDIGYVDPTNISFIEFYAEGEAGIFSEAAGGVFAIYLKLGASNTQDNEKRKPGIVNFKVEGFYTAKEFYAPDYSKALDEPSKMDIRTTLHWQPEIRISNDEGFEEISFYTCDMKGDYIIEIEGLTDSGIPVHETSYFTVN